MIEIENSILAVSIEFPEYIYLMTDSLQMEDFSLPDNRIIYAKIQKLVQEKEEISWIKIEAYLRGKTKEPILGRLLEYSRGFYRMGIERCLRDNIKTLKKENAKRAIAIEIERQVKDPAVELETIIEIAERGVYISNKDEDGGFEIAMTEYLEAKKQDKTNINMGYPTIDKNVGGLLFGELVGIMARTSVGKTFLALNIIEHMANKTDLMIGLFSQEMSKVSVIERIAQLHFGMTRWELIEKVRSGGLNLYDIKRQYEKKLNIYSHIYSTSEIGRIVERDALKIVFIDYLQLMRKTKGRSLYEATTYQIAELKEMAKNLDILIVLLIQVSRKAEGGWEPVTIDMARESGAIEENCDFLIGMWSPALKDGSGAEWENKLIVRLLKNKRGPSVGITCRFDFQIGKIMELGHE